MDCQCQRETDIWRGGRETVLRHWGNCWFKRGKSTHEVKNYYDNSNDDDKSVEQSNDLF